MKKGCLIGIVVILILGAIGSCLPDTSTTEPTTVATTTVEIIPTAETTELLENTVPTEETSAPTTEPSVMTTEPVKQPEPPEIMVWIPRSGSKYHQNSWCSNMKKPREVTLKYAEKHGYTPCKRCN